MTIEIIADQGQAVIRHKTEELRCRFQDVRHFIGLGVVLPELQFGSTKQAFEVIRSCIETRKPGIGPLKFDMTELKKSAVFEALLFILPSYFDGCPATVVRIGRGDRKLSHVDGFANSLIMYWVSGNSFEYHFAEFEGTQVDLRHLVGNDFPNIRYVQLLMVPTDHFPAKETVDSLSAPTDVMRADRDSTTVNQCGRRRNRNFRTL